MTLKERFLAEETKAAKVVFWLVGVGMGATTLVTYLLEAMTLLPPDYVPLWTKQVTLVLSLIGALAKFTYDKSKLKTVGSTGVGTSGGS